MWYQYLKKKRKKISNFLIIKKTKKKIFFSIARFTNIFFAIHVVGEYKECPQKHHRLFIFHFLSPNFSEKLLTNTSSSSTIHFRFTSKKLLLSSFI